MRSKLQSSLNFIEYDGSTNKQKRKLDSFMTEEALVLSQDILWKISKNY